MKISEAVRKLIRLGEVSREYWDRELPKAFPRYPIVRPGEVDPPAPPEDAQIESLLKRLSEEQIYALILLMYIGRGSYSADKLVAAYENVKEKFFSKELAIAQMTSDIGLAEYLTDALSEMQKRHIDIDHMNLASPVAAS